MNAPINWADVVVGIRRATLDDMPFIIELAQDRYPGRGIENGIPWMRWCIQSPARLVLVGSNSVGVCRYSLNYGFESHASVDMLASRRAKTAPLEALRMLRIMIQWAREKGVKDCLHLHADTGVDFEPFARRLGGKTVVSQRCEIPL